MADAYQRRRKPWHKYRRPQGADAPGQYMRTEIGQRTEPARCRLRAVRIFVVVAKNRPDLFEYFAAGFAGVQAVEVILDRRFGPDDELPAEVTASYRDRRAARDIYDELELRGFVVVRIHA